MALDQVEAVPGGGPALRRVQAVELGLALAVPPLLGGLLGLLAALAYAWGLLAFLNTRWPGSLDHSFLKLHATAQSFLIGYCSALLVSLATIAWAVRVLRRTSPSLLLGGVTTGGESLGTTRRRKLAPWIAAGCAVLGLALIVLGRFLHDHEAQAGSFFSGGGLLLGVRRRLAPALALGRLDLRDLRLELHHVRRLRRRV